MNLKEILSKINFRNEKSKPLFLKEVKSGEVVLEMVGITKRFGNVVANDNVNLEVKAGEIYGLLGENGAGKTTLMNILYGLYKKDEGEIFIHGEKVEIKSPKDALKMGIEILDEPFLYPFLVHLSEI